MHLLSPIQPRFVVDSSGVGIVEPSGIDTRADADGYADTHAVTDSGAGTNRDAGTDADADRHAASSEAVARARAAGISAAWTGSCDGTVQLDRLAGPHAGELTDRDASRFRIGGRGPWLLSQTPVRVAVYREVLTHGTQFDIYQWVNLPDLAAVWRHLHLPRPVRHEWAKVLRAAGLLGPARPHLLRPDRVPDVA